MYGKLSWGTGKNIIDYRNAFNSWSKKTDFFVSPGSMLLSIRANIRIPDLSQKSISGDIVYLPKQM